jgi:protein tyrosine phosphatase
VKCFGASETDDHPVYKDRDIEEEIQSKYSTTFSKQNPSKNRYGNILTYDDMSNGVPRVETIPIVDTNLNGYINASFAPRTTPDKGIRPDWNCPKFILSQCPKDNTITDFQNMIRLHNIRRIIMVTNLEELVKGQMQPKCDDYLALNNEPVYENVPFIVNEFKLYRNIRTIYGQVQEYTYTQLDSRERTGSSSSA